MRKLPFPLGNVHFIGIGGIGMSGIAEVLHGMGYSVQGSDIRKNANAERLESLGVKIFVGQKAENVANANLVVKSSAVKDDNAEIIAAKANKIPIIRRADMLAEIMRLKWSIAIAGTHGKTTTTSLVAHILSTAEADPTIINGGIINAFGTNARLGSGDWMVVEADESDGTFTKLPATIGVVTNVDPEHLDHFGSFDNLKNAFITFIENLPFYGFGVMCWDHETVRKLLPEIIDKKVVTYGLTEGADLQATITKMEPDGLTFDVKITPRLARDVTELKDVKLSMIGEHNVSNAMAAVAVAHQMGIKAEHIKQALRSFQGVKRRFTKVDEVNGIHIFDDYGHHPTEIEAVLCAASPVCQGRLIAVVQPHRFTRVRDLEAEFIQCFDKADQVFITPVYTAGEDPIDGVSSKILAEKVVAQTGKPAIFVEDPKALATALAPHVKSGDFVVCLGAGDITAHAHALPDALREALSGDPVAVNG